MSMDKEQFNQLMANPMACMDFHMKNWVNSPQMLDDNQKVLVDTFRKYLVGIETKDANLINACMLKFHEIAKFYLEKK